MCCFPYTTLVHRDVPHLRTVKVQQLEELRPFFLPQGHLKYTLARSRNCYWFNFSPWVLKFEPLTFLHKTTSLSFRQTLSQFCTLMFVQLPLQPHLYGQSGESAFPRGFLQPSGSTDRQRDSKIRCLCAPGGAMYVFSRPCSSDVQHICSKQTWACICSYCMTMWHYKHIGNGYTSRGAITVTPLGVDLENGTDFWYRSTGTTKTK